MDSETINSNRTIQQVDPQYTNNSALQMRLETLTLINTMEDFLSGTQETIATDELGQMVVVKAQNAGEPKANSEGIYGIIGYLRSVINSQTVQGNFTKDYYMQYLERLHVNLAGIIITNRIEWAIRVEDVRLIINVVMNLCAPFLSRTVDNKERESYPGTIVHSESGSQTSQSGSSGGLFSGLIGRH